MAIRLIDLREAALREYPEFGEAPCPVPWWNSVAWRCCLYVAFILAMDEFLVIVVTITRT